MGLNVAVVISWPALANSTKPMMEAIEVFLISWTINPTVGAMEMRIACGRITYQSCLKKPRDKHAAASHCGRGIAWIDPRQIYPMKAAEYSVKASETAVHASTCTPNKTGRP